MVFIRHLLSLGAALAIPLAAVAAAPEVSAVTATPGANGTATFSATVNANGEETTVVFEYGRNVAYNSSTAVIRVAAGESAANVSVPVSDLVGGRVYHFRVVARNPSGSAESADATFTELPFAPVLTIEPASGVVAARATLAAHFTANGNAGTAVFEYSTSASFNPAQAEVKITTEVLTVTGSEVRTFFTAQLSALTRDRTYHFRLVFRPAAGSVVLSGAGSFVTNQKPVAKPDVLVVRGLKPVTIDVLANDTDGDADALTVKLSDTLKPARGTVTISTSAKNLTYTPGNSFRGGDLFDYIVTDGFSAVPPVSATVTIRAFSVLHGGNHGSLVVDEKGEAVGYFKISSTDSGAFTGSVMVDGTKHSFGGVLAPDGTFRGTVEIDGKSVPVSLKATQAGTATTLDVSFDDGRWTASLRTTEASATERATLAGRYTVEFPGGTSTSDPANNGGNPSGTGWAAMKLSPDGVARVKGRLPDGRSFSTRGVLGVATTGPVVTFFDDPRRTRVSGTLSIGTAVAGSLRVERDSGGSGFFADGFSLQSSAGGARYLPPVDGKRAIEGTADASGKQLTFSVTGGNPAETFTRQLRLDKDDKVTVVDRDSEGLKVKIDRDSGRFTVSFTGSTNDRRIKGTGVFIQGTGAGSLGRGAGVFTGENGTGKVTISAGGSTTTPPPTPDPGTVTVLP